MPQNFLVRHVEIMRIQIILFSILSLAISQNIPLNTTELHYKDLYPDFSWKHYGPIKFYPIGWSTDNKFAFYKYYYIESRFQLDLNIIDATNDSTLFKKQYRHYVKEGSKCDLECFWKEHGEEILFQLSSYAIDFKETPELLRFPAAYGKWLNDTYIIDIDYKGIEKCSYGRDAFSEIEISLIRSGDNGLQRKTLSMQIYEDWGCPVTVSAFGYYKHPKNNFIAIVMMYVNPGFEYSPLSFSPKIICTGINDEY